MKAVKRFFTIHRIVLLAALSLGAGCRPYTPAPGARGWSLKAKQPEQPVASVGRRSARPEVRTQAVARTAALPVPNPYYRKRTANTTSRRRQEIVSKLKTITFEKIEYRGIPLGEVVRHLNEETKRLDPEKKGINFMLLSPTATSEASVQDVAGAQADPADPFAPPAAAGGLRIEEAELENVLINIDPPLRDLPLVHVLDAITKKADTSIQFAVTDYAVVIWPKTPRDADRFFRNFRSSPGAFQQGLEGVQGVPFNGLGSAQ